MFVKCSEEFVLGYVQLVDGERDPRNLLLVFNSVLVIVRNLHFGIYVGAVLRCVDIYMGFSYNLQTLWWRTCSM